MEPRGWARLAGTLVLIAAIVGTATGTIHAIVVAVLTLIPDLSR